ncbi:hypothetical protein K435DRAFT_786252 [Dendrothele bispora CBS 962.96]|uniref:Uncharacterized protein n=1 Tax=Dendrothele bispora (strain CBS 962.96) TaxID=1314807 RepID=A0A4S8KRQ5_DENBC|nr:hypothetical protein K435DRAFT_786252 [Dendrothele bispora CBS 962.96]
MWLFHQSGSVLYVQRTIHGTRPQNWTLKVVSRDGGDILEIYLPKFCITVQRLEPLPFLRFSAPN